MTRAAAPGAFSDVETALDRIGTCLKACGVEPDRDTSMKILALIQEGLQTHPDELLDWLMREARLRLIPDPPSLPEATPPLVRGSIGYEKSA